MRLIDADALMERVCGHECGTHFAECEIGDNCDCRCVFREYVSDQSIIEAEPVRHGGGNGKTDM